MTIRVRHFIANAAFALAVCVAALFGVEQSQAGSIQIPPGTSVTVHGNSAAVAMDNGVTGSFNCSCNNGLMPAKGTCSLTTNSSVIFCNKAASDTCNGACSLTTTTTGLTGAMAARTRGTGQSNVSPAAH